MELQIGMEFNIIHRFQLKLIEIVVIKSFIGTIK